ncbi:MAG TPA: hypothetical protein DHW49_05315 [Anaerolineae bacterium]|nr:hypothetical protein [Anaerolineae bacterium]
MNKNQNELISEAFSREAESYDVEVTQNPVMSHLREQIRNIAKKYFPASGSILEINAGSGLDALWFAEHGYRIHATDIADGMLTSLEKKIKDFNKPHQFTFQKLSFTELEKTQHAPFDGIFSNFGGLNCIHDLTDIVQGIKKVLKPNGYVVFVFMPKICFWEIAQIFLGRINIATRRFKKNGVQANVRGVMVNTYYFSSNQVKRWLSEDFEILNAQSLSLFAPPMNQTGFINRFPALTNFLLRCDEIIGKLPLFNQCGDFLIMVAKYKSQK